jgi:hypothetical protein
MTVPSIWSRHDVMFRAEHFVARSPNRGFCFEMPLLLPSWEGQALSQAAVGFALAWPAFQSFCPYSPPRKPSRSDPIPLTTGMF